jgi:hypothetical protein
MQSPIDPSSVSPKSVATTGSPASAPEIAAMTKVAASGRIAGRLRAIAAGLMPSGAHRNQTPTSPSPSEISHEKSPPLMDSDFETTVGMEKVPDPVSRLGGLKAFLDRVMTTERSETRATTPPRHGILSVGDIDRLLSEGSTQSPEDTALLIRAMLLKDLAGENSHVKSRQPTNSEAIRKLLLQNGLNWVDKKQLGISVVEGGQQKDLVPVLSPFGYGKDPKHFSESLSKLIKAGGKGSSPLGDALTAHFDSKTPKGGNICITCDGFLPEPSFHRDENSDNAYLLSLHIIKNSSGEYSIELDCTPDRRLSTQYIPHSECFMPSMNPKNEAAIIKTLGVRDSAELQRVITATNSLWIRGTSYALSELADNHCSSAALGTIIKQPSNVIHRSPSRKTMENVQEYMKQNKVTVYRVLLLKFC